jgi:hypothetical protein
LKKKALYEAAWILGLIGGVVCILFAILEGLSATNTIILGNPNVKGLTGIVNAAILGILGIFIIGVARMTRAGGERATISGVLLLVFGFVAYLVGGEVGAIITILTGILALVAKYV